MMMRSRRSNSRRFFRYQGELRHHFIRIGGHEKVKELQGDIYSSGVKHFTKIINQKLDAVSDSYLFNLKESLAENHPEAYSMFLEVLKKVEFLREILNNVSLGKIEIKESIRFLEESIHNGIDYTPLKNSQRTGDILKSYDEKTDQLLKATLNLIKNSTPHELYEGGILKKLQVDNDIKVYIDKVKKNKTKLLKALVDLYHYISLLEKIYNNISNSTYIIIFPEYWEDDYVSISCGGVGIYTEFLVEINDILEVFLRVNVSSNPDIEVFETIHQRAKVVRIDEVDGKYLLACEFVMCSAETMTLISNSIQAKEVIEAYESMELLGEA